MGLKFNFLSQLTEESLKQPLGGMAATLLEIDPALTFFYDSYNSRSLGRGNYQLFRVEGVRIVSHRALIGSIFNSEEGNFEFSTGVYKFLGDLQDPKNFERAWGLFEARVKERLAYLALHRTNKDGKRELLLDRKEKTDEFLGNLRKLLRKKTGC